MSTFKKSVDPSEAELEGALKVQGSECLAVGTLVISNIYTGLYRFISSKVPADVGC